MPRVPPSPRHPGFRWCRRAQWRSNSRPGKIISSEYENEGGSWRYSFDIQQKGNIQEIGIDGRTGKVVENKSEGKVDHD